MMTVRDVMTQSVITVRPGAPLKEVAQLLIDHRISGLLVVDDDGAVVGIVSEADFLVKEQGADAIRHRPLARIVPGIVNVSTDVTWTLDDSRLKPRHDRCRLPIQPQIAAG